METVKEFLEELNSLKLNNNNDDKEIFYKNQIKIKDKTSQLEIDKRKYQYYIVQYKNRTILDLIQIKKHKRFVPLPVRAGDIKYAFKYIKPQDVDFKSKPGGTYLLKLINNLTTLFTDASDYIIFFSGTAEDKELKKLNQLKLFAKLKTIEHIKNLIPNKELFKLTEEEKMNLISKNLIEKKLDSFDSFLELLDNSFLENNDNIEKYNKLYIYTFATKLYEFSNTDIESYLSRIIENTKIKDNITQKQKYSVIEKIQIEDLLKINYNQAIIYSNNKKDFFKKQNNLTDRFKNEDQFGSLIIKDISDELKIEC